MLLVSPLPMACLPRLCLCFGIAGSLLPPLAEGHPQPCRLLAQLGHSVQVGVLLPSDELSQSRARGAVAGLSHSGFLPYNLSLELVAGAPRDRDPASLARWLCQVPLARRVAAVLAFPQSRDELLQLDFLSAALKIPFISITEQEQLSTGVSPSSGQGELEFCFFFHSQALRRELLELGKGGDFLVAAAAGWPGSCVGFLISDIGSLQGAEGLKREVVF
ncbi:glutamate receptor ionotropic, NMDA 3B-like [Rhinatrema bivittatum]|uniref:glutamate receptor ionotropic, NMDA 3B-like n=1 Tax=Rhinatrema bivittatum TaxID=194408 RepID=UPI001129EFB9|nr:glutamate receptor ionotropic, NMDA 3B-like [Rhinatrema bivittatum]